MSATRGSAKRSKGKSAASTYGTHPELLPLKAAEKGVTKVHRDLLGLGISMGKKDMIKVMFEMVLEKVVNVKLKDGTSVDIEWKRGAKRTVGSTGPLFVENKEVHLDHLVAIPTTMWKSHATGRLVKKNVTFYLKRDKAVGDSGHTERITIGKVTMDLANFGRKDGQAEKVVLYFLKKLNSSPALHLRIKATWLELNKHLLTRVEGTPAKGLRVVDIEGVTYYLTDRADESDDSNKRLSASSESDSGGTGSTGMPVAVAPAPEGASSLVLSDMYEGLRAKYEMLEQTNYKQAKTIHEAKQSASKLSKEAEKMRDNAHEAKRTFKKEQSVLFAKVAELNATIHALRQELEGKDTLIRSQQKEIAELRRMTKATQEDRDDQDEHLSSVEAKYRALLNEHAETTRTISKQAAEIFAMKAGARGNPSHAGGVSWMERIIPSSTPQRMVILFVLVIVSIILW